MKLKTEIASYVFLIVLVLAVVTAFGLSSPAHSQERSPDLRVTFGCFQEGPVLNLASIWEKKGKYWFDEVANQYIQSEECFILYDPGYPAYIDRIVKKVPYKFKGEDTYVVQAHFYGAPPEKKFFFLYYGELPARAHRSAA